MPIQQGYFAGDNNLPPIIKFALGIMSTTYSFTDAVYVGPCVQGFLCAKYTLGAGVTSVDFKIQQAFSASVSDDWFDTPLLDVANKTKVNQEFSVPMLPYVFSGTSTATNARIGPVPVPLLLPFVRIAFKVTGVGTSDLICLLGKDWI